MLIMTLPKSFLQVVINTVILTSNYNSSQGTLIGINGVSKRISQTKEAKSTLTLKLTMLRWTVLEIKSQ